MDKTPEQLIKALTHERISPARKQAIRHMLQVYAHTYVPHRSLWGVFARHAFSYSALASLLLAGGATALAQRSLPGDLLYPVKLEVNDRVAVVVSGDEDARLDKELKQIERIIDEEESVSEQELENLDEDVDDEDEAVSLPEVEGRISQSVEDKVIESKQDRDLERELRDISAEIEEAARDKVPTE
jgi:hypothetical protein